MWKSRRFASAQNSSRRWQETSRLRLLKNRDTTEEAAPAYVAIVDEEEEEEVEQSVPVSCGKDGHRSSRNLLSFCRPSPQAENAFESSLGTFLLPHLKKFPASSFLRSHCNAFKRKCLGSLRGGVACFHLGFPVKEEKIDLAVICASLCELGIHVSEAILRTYRRFSLQELSVATSHFGADNVLRKGSSGCVYRGLLASTGESIAVKVMNSRFKDARLSFCRELEMMHHVRHDHIQPLLGYCIEDGNLLLVSFYMSRGSVDRWLHNEVSTGVVKKRKLSWEDRYKVVLGVAKALHYLHTECNPPIIHRDIKPSNILLSACNEAKARRVLDGANAEIYFGGQASGLILCSCMLQLSDFGLAMKASSPSLMCNEVMGTFGYLSPEYFQYGKVSTKMDVYSFGIVLLELLTGRFPIGHANLANWARHLLLNSQEFTIQMADPMLGTSFSLRAMQRLFFIGVLCIHPLDSCRPTIGKVLRWMQEEPAESLQYLVFEEYLGANSSPKKIFDNSDAHLRKQYLATAIEGLDGFLLGSPLITY